MASITIKVNDYLTYNKGITPDEGEPIFKILTEAFRNEQKVIMDFAGIEMMTTAFLNVVIGKLYETYKSEELKGRLSFENVSDATAFRIKKVTDNAKEFYRNQEEFNKSVKEVLDENN